MLSIVVIANNAVPKVRYLEREQESEIDALSMSDDYTILECIPSSDFSYNVLRIVVLTNSAVLKLR